MTRSNGFTLLEVLIALAIVSIGILATIKSVTMVASSAEELQNRQLADWVAQNRLAELRANNVYPEQGSAEGYELQGGHRFHWQEEIKVTPNALFRRVDIRVSSESESRVLSRLSGFVVKPLR